MNTLARWRSTASRGPAGEFPIAIDARHLHEGEGPNPDGIRALTQRPRSRGAVDMHTTPCSTAVWRVVARGVVAQSGERSFHRRAMPMSSGNTPGALRAGYRSSACSSVSSQVPGSASQPPLVAAMTAPIASTRLGVMPCSLWMWTSPLVPQTTVTCASPSPDSVPLPH